MAGSDESELPVEGDSYDKSICLDDVIDDDSSVDKGPVSVGINGVGSPEMVNVMGILINKMKCFHLQINRILVMLSELLWIRGI